MIIIIISCFFIYIEIGVALFAGLGLLILTLPFSAIAIFIMQKQEKAGSKFKDKRIKLINDVLNGMKVLKLYGWEASYMEQVMKIRDKEIVCYKKLGKSLAVIFFLWHSIPFLSESLIYITQYHFQISHCFLIVTLVSFLTYIFMSADNVLTPEKAFVTLTYISILRFPLIAYPFVINGIIEVGYT